MEPIIDKKQIGASEDYYENIHAVLNWMEQATQKRKNKWEEIHMSNASEFIIENGVLTKYVGPGGDVVVPEGVSEIGVGAFYMCRWLKSIVIPKSVTTIGMQAFRDCAALNYIEISDTVTQIGEWAFYGCKELKEVRVSQKVASMWDKAVFVDCPLEAFHGPLIPIEAYPWKSPSKNALAVGYAEMTESGITFDEGTARGYAKQIKSQKKKLYPLMICRPLLLRYMLNNKVIPVKDISECLNLAAQHNNPEVTALLLAYQNGTYTVRDWVREEEKAERETLRVPVETEILKKQWSTKKQPDGTLIISAYKGDETSITVPNKIGKGQITALEKELFSAEKTGRPAARKTFYAEKIESIVISSGIREIADQLFWRCEALKSVHIPDGITRIGKEAFGCCCSLAEILIPGSVTCVDERAFHNCIKLANVVLKEGTIFIGKEAFQYNFCLKTIRIPGSVTEIGEDAFNMCHKLTIHAPAGSYAEQYAKENNIPFVAE